MGDFRYKIITIATNIMDYIPAPTGLDGPMRSSSMALFMLEVEKDLVGFFSPMSFGGSNLFEAAPGTQWKK